MPFAPLSTAPAAAAETNIRRRYVYLVTGVVALGGLLFGFDLVVISGTIPFFTRHFSLSPAATGWAVGCVNLGSALGALVAGRLGDAIGRKRLLLLCAALFVVTGIGTGWAPAFGGFIFFRLGSGVAIGMAALVCPVFIAEMTPASLRGRLVSIYQLAIVTGLLLAYGTDYLLLNAGPDNWRWMFSAQAVPGLLFFAGLGLVPESPRWLVRKGRVAEAGRIFDRIGGAAYATQQVEAVTASFARETRESVAGLFDRRYRKVLVIGIAVAAFSQADGQNSLFSYAPEIFGQAGVGLSSAFLQSVLLGGVNFLFTGVAIVSMDRGGRKKLLSTGALLLAIDAALLAVSFAARWPAGATVVLVFAFIAIYAATIGPATWVVLSEIFPNRIRGHAMSLATLALWLANFCTTVSFPVLRAAVGLPATFGLHAFICLLYYVFIRLRIPETRGRSLEELERELVSPSA